MFKLTLPKFRNQATPPSAAEAPAAEASVGAEPAGLPYTGTQYFCPICSTSLGYFLPVDNGYLKLLDSYEYNYSLFHNETFNMLQYSCPSCHASDRERLYALYFQKRLSESDPGKKLKFIDFAPSEVNYFYRRFPMLDYRSADLYMDGVDDKIDITNMDIYEDNSVDVFLCSHVLEHVDDDRKAMSELYRILKPGGWGITMVPVLIYSEHIIENLPITSEAERWRFYGQGDHVRFYNRQGFVDRLACAGFKVNLLGVEYFGADTFERNGIHKRSVLYVVEKI